MAWKYRPDELTVLMGYGIPSSAQAEPTLYVDRSTGQQYLNQGAGSATWTAQGVSNVETLAAARVLVLGDSGKTFFLSLAGGFDITLPVLATSIGFSATFIVKTAPTTAYTLTGATADKILGLVLSSSGGVEDSAGAGDPGDVVNFVANTALPGDKVLVTCDGAFYYVEGRCAAAGGITITG